MQFPIKKMMRNIKTYRKTKGKHMEQHAAGIVLYNPDLKRLKLNIDAIYLQVKVVYIFNNGSNNIDGILQLLDCYNNVRLIDSKINLGIATALNRIAKQADQDCVKWLLTLDQDSVCTHGLIKKFDQYTKKIDIGIICPQMMDKRRPKEKLPINELSEVDFCMTSGSFISIDIYKAIGGFDDSLIIGLVDDEYCYRLRLNNYRIIRLNRIIIDHELGDIVPSRFAKIYLKMGEILSSNKIKSLSYRRKISPIRVYYATRNIVYLSKKYASTPLKKFSKSTAIYNGISNILRGQNKIQIILSFIKGFKDGYLVDINDYMKFIDN